VTTPIEIELVETNVFTRASPIALTGQLRLDGLIERSHR
jgi:hypothetical protein